MKKFGFSRYLFRIFLITLLSLGISVSAQNDDFYLRGIKNYTFKNKPYVYTGVSEQKVYMVPLRETLEVLGYDVNWNRNNTINLSKGVFKASLVVNADKYKNRYDEQIKLYVNPVYKDGICYVPHAFFSLVVGYDAYVLDNIFYLRNKLENVSPKLIIDDNVSISIPEFLEKSSKYNTINQMIMQNAKDLSEYRIYDKFVLNYDVASYSKDIISIIFRGKGYIDDKEYNIFDTFNYNLRKGTKIALNDIFISYSGYEEYILNKFYLGEDSNIKDQISLNKMNFYLVDGAIIISQNIYTPEEKFISRFFKNSDLSDKFSQDYLFLNKSN